MLLLDKLKKMHSGIMAVGVSTLLVAISTTAAFSVTPFFLYNVLGINILTIGLIEAVTESLSQFSRLLSGIVCDKMKRCKPMYSIGVFLSFLAKPLLLLANGPGLVIASKISDRLGNGLSATPRDQYVALNSNKEDKGANIGIIMTFKTIGCVVGPFLAMTAMWIFGNDVNLRWLLFVTTMPAFIAVYVAIRYMKDHVNSTSRSNKKEFSFKKIASLSSHFWIFFVIMFFFMLARVPECFLLINLKQSGLPQWFCTGAIGFFNLVSVFISYPAGYLSDKYGRTRILLFSFIALLAAALCFTTCSPVFGVLGVVFWGIQRSSSQIISVACITDMVEKEVLGTAIGLLNIASGGAGIIASWAAGLVSEKYGIAQSYFISFAFSLVACTMLCVFMKLKKTAKKA